MKNNQIPKIIKSKIYKDKRGSLKEIFKSKDYNKKFKFFLLVSSKKNVFRGFHFQKYPFAQDKFVRVISGKILDILVSVDKNSKFYLKSFYYELSDNNKKILYVPKNFAHGFLVLSKNATVEYFVTKHYSKKHERNISIFDKRLNIDRKIKKKKIDNVQ